MYQTHKTLRTSMTDYTGQWRATASKCPNVDTELKWYLAGRHNTYTLTHTTCIHIIYTEQ